MIHLPSQFRFVDAFRLVVFFLFLREHCWKKDFCLLSARLFGYAHKRLNTIWMREAFWLGHETPSKTLCGSKLGFKWNQKLFCIQKPSHLSGFSYTESDTHMTYNWNVKKKFLFSLFIYITLFWTQEIQRYFLLDFFCLFCIMSSGSLTTTSSPLTLCYYAVYWSGNTFTDLFFLNKTAEVKFNNNQEIMWKTTWN